MTLPPGDPESIALVAFATFHGVATLAAGGMLGDVPVGEVCERGLDGLLGGPFQGCLRWGAQFPRVLTEPAQGKHKIADLHRSQEG